MNIFTKAYLLQHVLRWRFTWDRRNTHYAYIVPGNPKFMSARDAVSTFIKDGDLVALSGLGAHQRPAIMYWAIRESFEETGHPRNLGFSTVAGMGGRGRMPGTLEELAIPELTSFLLSGHIDTFRRFLKIADSAGVTIQCLPQGVLALLVDAQMRGEDSLLLETGVGTFVDPRTGRGSPLTGVNAEQFVTVEGDRLRYRVPKAQVAIFNAPAVDREGNIYVKNAATICESYETAKAVKRNGGKVIANVGMVVEKGYSDVFLTADDLDAIVVNPKTEQTATILHNRHWPVFTTKSDISIREGIKRLQFISGMLGITPKRTPTDDSVARLGASLFARHARKGEYVNIGVGLPEEVCRVIYQGGLVDEITLLTETGVLGGLPASGVFFGAGICPKKIISSCEVFKLCYEKLDITILGALQVDSQGNVNVSKRGEELANYVGPGGFIDLTTAAKTVIFVSSWMARAEIKVEHGRVSIAQPGIPKFVDRVDEVTFNGAEALKHGKKVFYVTNVGAFRLTQRGMELIAVMPGIDVQRDIVGGCPMRVVLPESGTVPVVDDAIVSGKKFKLQLGAGTF